MAHVQLNDDVVAALSAKAASKGLTLQAYLEGLVVSESPRAGTRVTVDELDRLLDEHALTGPSLQGTFSRAELYSDHD